MSRMLAYSVLLGLLSSSAVACGGIAVFDDGAGGDAATATATATSGTTTKTTATATTKATSTSAAVTTGGSQNIVATIFDVVFTANCQPGFPPDPLNGFVGVRYDNVGNGPGSIAITDARLSFATPMEGWVFPFKVDPTSSGVLQSGASATVTHEHVGTLGDASFACNLCGQTGTVHLRYDNSSTVEASFGLACAF